MSFSEFTKLIVEARSKLNAHCADCIHVSEIDWNVGSTRLSGRCIPGQVDLINLNGGRGSLYQKRKCVEFSQSCDPHQAERVEGKILEAEAALRKYLHSSHVTTSVLDADRVASEQQPAVGTTENRQPPTQIKPEFGRTR